MCHVPCRALVVLAILILAGCGQDTDTRVFIRNSSFRGTQRFGANEGSEYTGTSSQYDSDYGYSTSDIAGGGSGFTEQRTREDGRQLNIERYPFGQRKGESIWAH